MSNLDIVFALAAALAVLAMLAGLGVVLAIAMAREDGAGVRDENPDALTGAHVPGLTLLWRAMRRRCPRCGEGRIFRSYLKMNQRCPECDAVFWADQGEWLGPFVLDYACATAAAIAVWAVLELTAPDMRLLPELALLGAAIVGSALLSFPFTRSLWTIFLYISGAMGERPIRAADTSRAASRTPK